MTAGVKVGIAGAEVVTARGVVLLVVIAWVVVGIGGVEVVTARAEVVAA